MARAKASGIAVSRDAVRRGPAARDPAALLLETRAAQRDVERGDAARATTRLREVLRQEPLCAPAWAALAQARWLAGHPEAGLRHARRAVAIQPPNPHFRLILAQLCTWQGRRAEARAALDPVLRDHAHDAALQARALTALAEWHLADDDHEPADAALRAALALQSELPDAHALLGMSLLSRGQFDPGWREWAWRQRMAFRQRGNPLAAMPGPERPIWQGEPLPGATILVWDDQGSGDAIQFFRYLPLLRARDPGGVIWLTHPHLRSLLARSAPDIAVVSEPPTDRLPDWICPSSSLPEIFGTRLDSIPAEVPYLQADDSNPPRRRRSGRPLVGLVWSGDPQHLRDHARSIPAAAFLRLAELPGLRFISLQVPVRPRDAAALAAHPAVAQPDPPLRDFADTAALIARLDLVITVDTAVAHLAGALGCPVWILLPRVADWRWLRQRSDSPWYPTARLFRADGEDWAPVLDCVASALRAFAVRRRGRHA